MFQSKVVLDSVNNHGNRLTTLELTYPRIIHSEVLTHRDRARNSASSRAIPYSKMRANILENPFIPVKFGSKQAGMQMGEGDVPQEDAQRIWLAARDKAVKSADLLDAIGVHKSIVNRITEPWMWITVIMTATEWKNFLRLRDHPDAEIHIQIVAKGVRSCLDTSQPVIRNKGEWHLPYIHPYEVELYPPEILCKMSVARCARVSYLTHDGQHNYKKDLELYEKLVQGSGFGHWSPHEHVCEAGGVGVHSGPFKGWYQFRKKFAQENADNE